MHQPGLSADLDSFDLLDLVQVIQMTRRNLSLVVRAGSQRLGMLRFAQGELLWAEFGELRGAEAFMALAAHHSGSIEELAWDGREERNVSQPLARLVMQAVEYRDNHENRQPQPPPASPVPDSRSRPVQPANQPSPLIKTYELFNGASNGSSHLGSAPAASEAQPLEDDEAPAWVRNIHPAGERAAPTGNTPGSAASPGPFSPQPTPAIYLTQTEPLTPPPGPAQPRFTSLLQEEMAVEIPEPTVPLSTPNGKFSLPSHANGNRPSLATALEEKEDPPTVPLPSMQSGLRNYAAKRELPAPEPQREAVPETKLALNPLPGPAFTMRAMPAVATPPPPTPVVPEPLPLPQPAPTMSVVPEPPLPPPEPPAAAAPAEEPKLSSLAILEQLAYGGLSYNNIAEAAPLEVGITAAPAAPQPPVSAAPLVSSPPISPVAQPMAEGQKPLEQALETFAEQVGSACVATAVIRSDGKLMAEYKVRRGQDQDLASPAYHMSQVMQSSLRALLMGGWGDLEDTFITGSTHSVMLRRLGRAEKGLFHIAVLERSGNPGLCRVRMRNNEAALLQHLSVDLPTRAS